MNTIVIEKQVDKVVVIISKLTLMILVKYTILTEFMRVKINLARQIYM